jgi:hypothetical protein
MSKISTLESSMVPGKLELNIKINQLPEHEVVKNGWIQFVVDCGDRAKVQVTVKPKVWKKLTEAQANYPLWVASITGTLGNPTTGNRGFILETPAIQVFERKPKEPKPEPETEPVTPEVAAPLS